MDRPPHVRDARGAWSSLLLGLGLVAAGIGAGQLLKPAIGHACVCGSPYWPVTLSAVESDVGSPDHAEHWPADGRFSLSVYSDVAHGSLRFVADDRSRSLAIEGSSE